MLDSRDEERESKRQLQAEHETELAALQAALESMTLERDEALGVRDEAVLESQRVTADHDRLERTLTVTRQQRDEAWLREGELIAQLHHLEQYTAALHEELHVLHHQIHHPPVEDDTSSDSSGDNGADLVSEVDSVGMDLD